MYNQQLYAPNYVMFFCRDGHFCYNFATYVFCQLRTLKKQQNSRFNKTSKLVVSRQGTLNFSYSASLQTKQKLAEKKQEDLTSASSYLQTSQLQGLFYKVCITKFVLQSIYYKVCITKFLLQSIYHKVYKVCIIKFVLQSLYYKVCITKFVLLSLYYKVCIIKFVL